MLNGLLATFDGRVNSGELVCSLTGLLRILRCPKFPIHEEGPSVCFNGGIRLVIFKCVDGVCMDLAAVECGQFPGVPTLRLPYVHLNGPRICAFYISSQQ